ncbi:MAG TPA: crosslink repair DNA glycosylase YcaQ family protein [Mycobacteriales bacterium]|nr:crosslink repair DNA glycosylase YcaQ family protein [Mycobacteriales bacterium]
MAVVRITRAQALARRVVVQGLLRDAPSLPKLAVLDLGLQETPVGAARQAAAARLSDAPEPGTQRGLTFAWSHRGAPHVHRAKDLPALAKALWPATDADAASRLDASASFAKNGTPALEGFARVVDTIRSVVTEPMDKGAVSGAVTKELPPEYSRYCRVCGTTHVYELLLRLGCLPAGVEIVDLGPPLVLAPAPKPTTTPAEPSGTDALARTFLHLLGPATPAELAKYIGTSQREVRRAWPEADVTEADVDGAKAWVLSSDVEALRKQKAVDVVRFLPPSDTWVQDRNRAFVVPDAAFRKQVWPILAPPGVLLVDGEVAALWRTKQATKGARTKLTINLVEVHKVPAAVRKAAEAEAERVAAARSATDVVLQWSSG